MIECKSDTSSCNNIFSGLNFLQPFCVKITDFNFPNIFQPLFRGLNICWNQFMFFRSHIYLHGVPITPILVQPALSFNYYLLCFWILDSCAVIENKYFSYFPIQICIPFINETKINLKFHLDAQHVFL